MNILIITTRLPYPMVSGAKIRAYHLLRSLAENHKVTLISFYGSTNEEKHFDVYQSLGVKLVPVLNPGIDRQVGLGELCRSLVSGLPLTVSKYLHEGMKNAIADNISSADILHCEHMHMASYLLNNDKPKVLDAHNVETQIAERYSRHETNVLKKLILSLNSQAMRRYEKNVCRAFDLVLSVSPQDQQMLKEEFSARCVMLLENGVDVEYFADGKTSPAAEPKKLVFVGAMDWLPNSDGITYFIKDILPLIRRHFPDIRLDIVGKDPPEDVRQFSDIDGIRVTGTVDDVRPFVYDSHVYVVPLRFGGGSRLKILEAFSLGIPVVSTSLGCEGIECSYGKDLLVADDPADFAASVIRLLKYPETCSNLTTNARKLAVNTYSWKVICQKLLSYYGELETRSKGLKNSDKTP